MNANVHKTKYSDFTAVMALFQPLVGSLFFLTTMFSREMILSLFVAGAEGVEVQFSWQAQGLVRLRGVTQVTFRGRRSPLCALDVRTRRDSWRAQGWPVYQFLFIKIGVGGTQAEPLQYVCICLCICYMLYVCNSSEEVKMFEECGP